MKLYRVTTTFFGADAPSHFFFDEAEKAEAFLETECQNGLYEPVDVLLKGNVEPNYFDGCTLNDLTYGQFKAKVIALSSAGWYTTKALGDVYLDEHGNVVRTVSDDGQRTLYPYRAKMVRTSNGWRQDGWDNCSGDYKPSYFARLIREGKAIWS